MRDLKRSGVVLLLSVLGGGAWAGETPPSATPRAPEFAPEHLAPAASWAGFQVLQADAKGRLFLLSTETLEVFPLSAEGTLGEPEKLQPAAELPANLDRVLRAAMSRSGDWVLLHGLHTRLFRNSREVPLEPLPWWVSSVGMLGDDPVVSGSSREAVSQAFDKASVPQTLSWIHTWGGRRWDSFVSMDTEPRARTEASWLRENQDVHLFGAADGRLWVAYEYQHRFREYSPAGRLLTEVYIGAGEVQRLPNARQLEKKAAEEAARMSSDKITVRISENTAKRVIGGLTEGRDGRIYFLVSAAAPGGEEGSALERYDPATLSLDRLALRLPELRLSNLAAGRDGLYIAPYSPKDGIWRISWEALEAASWLSVEDANISQGKGPADLEGAYREKGGKALLRFAVDQLITFDKGRAAARGIVRVAGAELLLRREGFGETIKVTQVGKDLLRVEADGKTREYVRLSGIPEEVTLAPFALGTATTLPKERLDAIRAELAERVRRSEGTTKERAAGVASGEAGYLRRLAGEIGWIDRERFGATAPLEAARLLLRDPDIALLKAALPQVEADLAGTPEGAELHAALVDTLHLALGNKQRFGTRVAVDEAGSPVLLPLESRSRVDQWRATANLPPLKDSLARLSQAAFGGKRIRIEEGELVAQRPINPVAPGTARAAERGL